MSTPVLPSNVATGKRTSFHAYQFASSISFDFFFPKQAVPILLIEKKYSQGAESRLKPAKSKIYIEASRRVES